MASSRRFTGRVSFVSVASILGATLFFCACASGERFDASAGPGAAGGTGAASPGAGGSGANGGAGGSETGGGGGAGGSTATECAPGATASCYSGPDGTEGIGICKAGTKVCEATGAWGPCQGDVVPKTEDCSQPEDEDCSGHACSEPLWAKLFGDASEQYATATTVDPDGNLIVAGRFMGSIDFGAGPLLTSIGGHDIFVAKLNPSGGTIWAESFGSPGQENVTAIAADATGIVLTGSFEQSMVVGADNLVAYDQADAFALKIDPAGAPLWAQQSGGYGNQAGTAIALDAQGNVYVGGYFFGNFAPCGWLGCSSSAGGADAYIVKYDDKGIAQWVRRYGGPGMDSVAALAVDPSGVVHVAGSFQQTIGFGGVSLTSAGGYDIFLLAMDEQGNVLTAQRFGDAKDQTPTALAVDAAGNMVLSGTSNGTIGFGSVALTTTSSHGFVAKLTPNATASWIKDTGKPARLALDAAGNVALTGTFTGSVDLGGGDLQAFAGSTNIFLGKLDPQGQHIWSKKFGFDADQDARGITVDAQGNVYVVGSSADVVDFGLGPLTSAGGLDVAIAAFAP